MTTQDPKRRRSWLFAAVRTLADLSSPESCLDPATAFNMVPSSGGVDLYLRIPPDPPYTGFNECFANGVPPNQAAVLSAVPRPAAVAQLGEPSGPRPGPISRRGP
jgi:hypothetical protein